MRYDPLAVRMLITAIKHPELGPRYTWPGVKRETRPVIRTRSTGRYRRAFDGATRP